jgi:death-on-curing protein
MAASMWYPSVDDVLALHEDIVSEYPDTPSGVATRGDVEFTLDYIENGSFGSVPELIHEKAYHLLRLFVANHPFVDANKRTALNTAAVFYALNGYRFEYDNDIRAVLKNLGTDETRVDEGEIVAYLRTHTGDGEESPSRPANAVEENRRESVRRVAAVDRESNRDVYDALENE